MKLGSDYSRLSDMYELKLGHELRLLNDDYILKVSDSQSLDIFIDSIYNQYMREA